MSENIPVIPKKTEADRKKILVYGCLSAFVLMIFACSGVLAVIYREKIPYLQNYFPTQTVTPPHILVLQPAKGVKVTNEDFSNNLGEWSIYYSLSKAEVKEGKLFLESFDDDSFAIGYCDFCSFVVKSSHYLYSPYYLQADFNTDHEVNAFYGLVFNSIRKKHSYYTFTVNPVLKKYILDKFQDDEWVNLSAGKSNLIRSYPETNTLSVDFEAGVITLYINGQAVTGVTDKNPTDFGKVGAFVGDVGFKLIVDNLFAYHK